MKLRRIVVENLNSLYGRHEVDLEETLAGANLFLIHGPTGSGKSTLMDAVSLALFGATPRLDSSYGVAAANPQLIMSRGTGSCSAEVEFSKWEGDGRQVYRASWSTYRARKTPDGKLQSVRRRLEQRQPDGSWKALTDDHRGKVHGPVFARVLEGFDVSDFNRSMLLAQGRFDAFLSADAAERAEILERLTDTSHFIRIGERASRMRSRHQRRIEGLRTLAQAGSSLTPEQVTALEEAHQSRQVALDKARSVLKRAETHRNWQVRSESLQQEVQDAFQVLVEARQAQTEARDALDRLVEHERCADAGAFQALWEARAADQAATTARAEHGSLHKTLPAQREQAGQAEKRAQAASSALSSATAFIEQLRPVAEVAASALRTWRQAESRRAEVAVAVRKANDDKAAAERQAQAERATHAEAQAAVVRALQALAEAPDDAPLAAGWAQIRERLTGLRDRVVNQGSRQRTLREQRKSAQEARARLAEYKAAFEAGRAQALRPLEETVTAAQARLMDQLSGGDLAETRAALSEALAACSARRESLLLAQAPVSTRSQAIASLEGLQSVHARRRAEVDRALAALPPLEVMLEQARERLDRSEAAHSRATTIAALVDYRSALSEGEACPLCGAKEHPRLADQGRVAAEAQIRDALEESTAALQAAQHETTGAQQALQTARSALKTAEALLREATRELNVQQEASNVAQAAARAALEAGGLPAEAGEATLASALSQAEANRGKAQEALAQLQSAQEAHQAAQNALEEAKQKQAEDAHAMAVETARLETQEQELRRRREQLKAEAQRIAQSREEAHHTLVQVGLQLAPEVDTAQWIEAGDARVKAHQERMEAHQRAQEDEKLARERLDGALRLVATHDKSVTEQAQALKACETAVQSARDSHEQAATALREQWVGGVSSGAAPDLPAPPERPEEHLVHQRQRIAQLDRRVREAADARHAAQTALTAAEARLKSLHERMEATEAQQVQAAQRLSSLLEELGLAEASELTARQLSQEERRTLSEQRERLREVETAAEAALEVRRKAQAEHTAAQPETLPRSATLESLEEACVAARAEAETAETNARETGEQLAVHRSAEAEQKENRRLLQDAEAAARIWLQLHELIGRSGGRAFKEFAQALNLRQLLERANVHLGRLHDRYELVPTLIDGVPTLEFELADLWQASARVSARSLSGGERFLVSLALALGLSDFRSIRMPIETLLLDEGFGTLDQSTLSTALGALNQLQADGRQVGIISHVVGLAERIAAQIQVLPMGGGRSRVVVGAGAELLG